MQRYLGMFTVGDQRMAALEGLRGVAAFLVVIHHYVNWVIDYLSFVGDDVSSFSTDIAGSGRYQSVFRSSHILAFKVSFFCRIFRCRCACS
jgi:peptidoglycan/LPS O-acetylase OafA/YrhL